VKICSQELEPAARIAPLRRFCSKRKRQRIVVSLVYSWHFLEHLYKVEALVVAYHVTRHEQASNPKAPVSGPASRTETKPFKYCYCGNAKDTDACTLVVETKRQWLDLSKQFLLTSRSHVSLGSTDYVESCRTIKLDVAFSRLIRAHDRARCCVGIMCTNV